MVTFNEASALAKDRGLNFREAQELLALQEAKNRPAPVQPAVDPAIAYGLGYDPSTAAVQQTELPPLPTKPSTGGSSGGSKSVSTSGHVNPNTVRNQSEQTKQTLQRRLGDKAVAGMDLQDTTGQRVGSRIKPPVRKPADTSAGVAATSVPGKSYGPGSQTGVVDPSVAPGQAGAGSSQPTDDSHWRNIALAILTGLGVATGAHLLGKGGAARGSRPRPTGGGTGTAVDTGGLVGQVLPPQSVASQSIAQSVNPALAAPQPRAEFTPPTQLTGPSAQPGTNGVPVGQSYSPTPSGPINQGMSPQPGQLSAPVNHNMPQDIYARGLPQTQGLTFDQLLAVLGGYAQHQGIGPR
jgi:hypothetical protein